MCGFAGWAGADPAGRGSDAVLRRMGRHLAARGPDEETTHERPGFHIVFRRLAIVDVAGGTQPFESRDGRLVVAVNGEIYNHRDLTRRHLRDVAFTTRSDCEVVLHLFRKLGPDFLTELNGIYAIAIWDSAKRRLLLARDRLGVKPLYYATAGDTLIFASELKALLAHPEAPRAIDWPAFHFLPGTTFPFDRPTGRPVATGVKDVRFVEPATYLEWRDGHVRGPFAYWRPAGPAPDDVSRSTKDYVDECAGLLDDSVRMQLMSDVPVGVFLSGGLDSSVIAALAARHAASVTAFTLAEPSIAATGDTRAAMDLAARLDMPLHLARVDQDALRSTIGLTLEMLEYFVWLMDFPLFDVEFLFKHELHRHAKHVNQGLKVVLLGQGADEFAGGYSSLNSEGWDEFTRTEASSLHVAMARDRQIPEVFRPYVGALAPHTPEHGRANGHAPWQYLRFGDLAAYNLWHEDRTAAANGIEARVPFLDHRLVEFLCAIPLERRAELFFDKAILRRSALRDLPQEFATRPKVPLYARARGAHDSVSALYRAIVNAAFEPFCEKYASANGLFARTALVALRDQAVLPHSSDAGCQLLLRCMTVGIFERMCREMIDEAFTPPSIAGAPAPLGASSLPAAPPEPILAADSRVDLADAVRLAVSCDRTPVLLVIEHGVLAAQIQIPDAIDGDAVTLFSGRSFGIDALARAFGGSVDDVKPLAEAFVRRGWGTIAGRGE